MVRLASFGAQSMGSTLGVPDKYDFTVSSLPWCRAEHQMGTILFNLRIDKDMI
jgi:hypothetical protein